MPMALQMTTAGLTQIFGSQSLIGFGHNSVPNNFSAKDSRYMVWIFKIVRFHQNRDNVDRIKGNILRMGQFTFDYEIIFK